MTPAKEPQDTNTRLTLLEEKMRDYISGATITMRFESIEESLTEIKDGFKLGKNWAMVTLFGIILGLIGIIYTGMKDDAAKMREALAQMNDQKTEARVYQPNAAHNP